MKKGSFKNIEYGKRKKPPFQEAFNNYAVFVYSNSLILMLRYQTSSP